MQIISQDGLHLIDLDKYKLEIKKKHNNFNLLTNKNNIILYTSKKEEVINLICNIICHMSMIDEPLCDLREWKERG
jgi:regulatory protein YycI of two-component signal transduction system YycFG